MHCPFYICTYDFIEVYFPSPPSSSSLNRTLVRTALGIASGEGVRPSLLDNKLGWLDSDLCRAQ